MPSPGFLRRIRRVAAHGNEHRDPPWRAGLQAARANVIPGAFVQAIMLALLLAYFFLPAARPAFEFLEGLKAEWGYAYSFTAAMIAGAFIPEILRVAFFQKGRPTTQNFRNFLFTIPFWGGMGLLVDLLYRLQAQWFGTELSLAVVVPKVIVDQFVYNPLVAGPLQVWLYHWKNHGYRCEGLSDMFTARYYRDEIVPTLFASWGVWIPIVSILYSLPPLLQIPLFSIALSLWVVLYTWISESAARKRKQGFDSGAPDAIEKP